LYSVVFEHLPPFSNINLVYIEKVNSRLVLLDLRSGKGFAEDYYLDAKSQCAGKRGACPDRWVPVNGVSSSVVDP
jgi:hypothetical protein